MTQKKRKWGNPYLLILMDGMLHYIPNNLKKDNQKLLTLQDKTWLSLEPKTEKLTLYTLIALIWEHIWEWEEK